MKIIDETLYLEFKEAIDSGIAESAIKKASYRNSATWHFINDPKDKRKLLIGYEALQEKYKKLIQERFGNPYDYIAKAPIKKLVETDFKAEQFYKSYRYDSDKYLPIEHVKKYTSVASWLNMLLKLNDNKKFIKKELGLSIELFWINVSEIIKTDNIDLPTTYQRLRNKMSEYKKEGYECLIHGHFGNKLSAKIGKTINGFDPELEQTQVAIILNAASRHQNFDAMQITCSVNKLFELQNWPTVSHGTVYNIIKENGHLTVPGSRGKREYNSKIAMQVTRKRPEYPLHFIVLDGWTVELLYQEGNTYNNRLVMVVVLDAMNNYPLGYAIGDRENTDLIRQANRNAAEHINELFGSYYQPLQLQSDRYGLKNLTPFYQSMAHLHTPAAVGNAKAKVIEPYFKEISHKHFQYQPNWSGHNVTSSKNNQPNTEFLDKIKDTFPDRQGVIKQIEWAMQRERAAKQQAYLAKWAMVPEADKISLNKMDMLMVFGKPTGFTNTITGQGLTPTIEGHKMFFDTFDKKFRALQHLEWQVIYDENDLSNILVVSKCNKHRFLLEQKRIVPMDIHSMVPEDHKYLSKTRNFNKEREQEIMQVYAENARITQETISKTPLSLDDDSEIDLKLMFTYNGQQKEKLQDAKGLKQVQQKEQRLIESEHKEDVNNWQQLQQQYLQSKTDFNQYND